MIKVALVGIGNCSSSLLQAINAAKNHKLDAGLSHEFIGPYDVASLDVVAAFDVAHCKVGRDLAAAALDSNNITTRYADIPPAGFTVDAGPLLDGISPHMSPFIPIHALVQQASEENVIQTLRDRHVDVVVNYLPVGSTEASKLYACAAVKAGCAFVNCTPAPLANDTETVQAFKDARLPLLGDDIKSQIGSTAIHQVLIKLLNERGLKLTRTYQLNIGGNNDFRNMRQPERGLHKKATKEGSLTTFTADDVAVNVGPSDYVPLLEDHKVAYMHLEGVGILGMPFSMDLQLRVEDSPNSAGIVLNAVRIAKCAMDKNMSGVIHAACPALFKAPPIQVDNDLEALQTFIDGCVLGVAA